LVYKKPAPPSFLRHGIIWLLAALFTPMLATWNKIPVKLDKGDTLYSFPGSILEP